MPSGNGSTPPPVYTVGFVTVAIDGLATADQMNTLLFSSASPPAWSIDAPKHIFHGNGGVPEPIIGTIQKPQYGTMTLTQGWDSGFILAKWKALIEDPNTPIDQKKKHVTVTWMQSDGKTQLFGWDAPAALLVGYTHSASDASSNGVLTVTATIDADSWQQLDNSGQPITGGGGGGGT